MGKVQLNARIRGTYPHCEPPQEKGWIEQRGAGNEICYRICQEDAIADLQLGIGVRTPEG